jgi:hypothetical protein
LGIEVIRELERGEHSGLESQEILDLFQRFAPIPTAAVPAQRLAQPTATKLWPPPVSTFPREHLILMDRGREGGALHDALVTGPRPSLTRPLAMTEEDWGIVHGARWLLEVVTRIDQFEMGLVPMVTLFPQEAEALFIPVADSSMRGSILAEKLAATPVGDWTYDTEPDEIPLKGPLGPAHSSWGDHARAVSAWMEQTLAPVCSVADTGERQQRMVQALQPLAAVGDEHPLSGAASRLVALFTGNEQVLRNVGEGISNQLARYNKTSVLDLIVAVLRSNPRWHLANPQHVIKGQRQVEILRGAAGITRPDLLAMRDLIAGLCTLLYLQPTVLQEMDRTLVETLLAQARARAVWADAKAA